MRFYLGNMDLRIDKCQVSVVVLDTLRSFQLETEADEYLHVDLRYLSEVSSPTRSDRLYREGDSLHTLLMTNGFRK